MAAKQIMQLISDASKHENNTGTLATLLLQCAQLRGGQPTAADTKAGVALVLQYVVAAPVLLEFIKLAAHNADIADEIGPIINTAEQYFLAPFDFIPDHLGLVGLMDDAYLAHRLVEGVCDRYTQQTGKVLISLKDPYGMDNFRKMSEVVRGLIGEPMATQLDLAVQGSLGMPLIQQALAHLMKVGPRLGINPVPSLGGASMQEEVNARLGAMGIV